METKNPVIIRKVSVIDSLRAITPGCSAHYRASSLALYTSACSAVSRLNKAAGREEFTITTDDNGATYTVSRTA